MAGRSLQRRSSKRTGRFTATDQQGSRRHTQEAAQPDQDVALPGPDSIGTGPDVTGAESTARWPRFVSRLRLDWWWIAILVICGSFQIYRGAPVDGAFFLGAGAALLADAAGWLAKADRYRLPRVRFAAQVALGAIAVAVITFAPPWGIADVLVVGVVGVTALIVGWRDDEQFPPGAFRSGSLSPRPAGENRADGQAGELRRAARLSAVLWACAGVFLCLWELSSFFLAMPSAQAEADHPPLSDLIGPIVANPVGRAACVALWLAGGAALLRRGRHP